METRLGFVAIWIGWVGIAMHFSWNIFPDYTMLIWILALGAACMCSSGFSMYAAEAARFKEDYAELQGNDEAVKVSIASTWQHRITIINNPIVIVASQLSPRRIGSSVTARPELWTASTTWLATCLSASCISQCVHFTRGYYVHVRQYSSSLVSLVCSID